MAKNDTKWPKNDPKRSEMFRQMVQMRQGIPTPNYMTQNGGKLLKKNTKNGQNDPKMAKNDPKWPKTAQNGLKCLGKWSK